MSGLIGESAHRLVGMAIFEGGPQRTLNEGTRVLASRATQFLSKSSAHRGLGASVSRLIGVSAHLLPVIAIYMDFARKICDFEAAPQGRLNANKGLEASRATKFLSKSSAHR